MTEASRVQEFGKYQLIEKIGAGGMAEIYKARYTGIDGFEKMLVLKKILPNFADNTAFIKMLINEAKLTSGLHHTNIVQIFDLGEINDQYYIAMEYVDGQDLLKIMAQSSKLKLRIPMRLIVYMLSEVCKGLAYAHNACDSEGNNLNIIHRDVSPSNVLISKQGEVKITDFGVARATQKTKEGTGPEKTRAGTLKGKLGYMSPEQVTGKKTDYRSDIFALGIVFFEMITLKRLFLGKTDLDTMINIRDAKIEEKFKKYPFIPEDIRAILRRALSKDRDQRYQTAEEFQDFLTDYLFANKRKVSNKSVANYLNALFSAKPRDELAKLFPRELYDPRYKPPKKQEPEPPKEVVAAPRPSNQPQDGVVALDDEALQKSVFRLRDKEGNIVGPITYHSLVNLIQARSIDASELVSMDEKTWVSVSAIPKLKEQFPPETLAPEQKRTESEAPPRYKGAVSPFTTPKLLYRLSINKVDGRLKMVHDKTIKEVYLRDGEPVHVNSNIKSELMGEFMVAHKFISSKQLATALQQTADFDGRLGDVLISMQMIQPHELYEVLKLQFVERLLEVFSWTRGEYFFYLGDDLSEEPLPLNVSWTDMLTEGSRSRVPFNLLEKFFKNHWNKPIHFLNNPYSKLENFKLNAKEIRVCNLIRSQGTLSAMTHVEHVLESIGLETVYRVMFLLLQTEFIQIAT